MNKTVIDGEWKRRRGQVQAWPGQLAGDPLSPAAGRFTKLIGTLQEKYGYNRERAARELKRQLTKHQARRDPR